MTEESSYFDDEVEDKNQIENEDEVNAKVEDEEENQIENEVDFKDEIKDDPFGFYLTLQWTLIKYICLTIYFIFILISFSTEFIVNVSCFRLSFIF